MQYVLAVLLGVCAAIGIMTLVAVMYVMRFGDSAFASIPT